MEKWQFNILFFVGVGGVILLFIGPEFGLNLSKSPTALTGLGAILTYVLTQKSAWISKHEDKKPRRRKEENDGLE